MSYTITGLHGIEERLKTGDVEGMLYLCRETKRYNHLVEMARRARVGVQHIVEREMERIAGVSNRGICLVAQKIPTNEIDSLDVFLQDFTDDTALFIILDGVTDVHNYGAILRSADQFACDLVIMPSKRSVKDTQTVLQTSAGALPHVRTVVVPNMSRAIASLKDSGFWIYGTDMDGEPVDTVDMKGRTAIVLGSEGGGVGRLVKERCDRLITIPTRGKIDSLNVSVAAGIIMYETRRQQWK